MKLLSTWTRWAALPAWAASIVTLLIWFGWPWGLVLGVPLWFAAPGLLRGRGYTYAWLSLLTLLYMALGLTEAFANPAARALATAHAVSAGALFLCCVLTVRWRAVERRGQLAPDERHGQTPPGGE